MTPSKAMMTPKRPNANVWMYDESCGIDRVDAVAVHKAVLLDKAKEALVMEVCIAAKLLFQRSAKTVGAMAKMNDSVGMTMPMLVIS